MTQLSPIVIDEKGGHKILRQVTESFKPWCAECKQTVGDPPDAWYAREVDARRVLREHVASEHGVTMRVGG